MIRAIVTFELVRRIKMISTYVYGTILFGAGLLMMLASGGVFSSVTVATSNERVMINGPHALFSTIGIIALFGIFTVAAIFGQAAYQDFGHGTWMIIFTKNVKKGPYLVGRFLGVMLFSSALFLTIGLGQLLGSAIVHLLHPETLGPTSVLAYVWPYLTQVWPMLFFSGALFFSLAAVTRRMAPVYVGAVVLVLGYLLATTLVQDVESRKLATLLDPFGFLSFGLVTRYWTPAEQNHDLVPVASLFGINRVLWTMLGAGLLAFAIRRFRTSVDEHPGGGRDGGGRPDDEKEEADDEHSKDIPFPKTTASPTTLGWARASLGFALVYSKEIIRSGVFWALMISALFFVTIIVLVSKEIYGTATLPVTYQVLELTMGGFRLFAIIIVSFYAGELVWRERDVGIQDIMDASRAPTWVTYIAKLIALFVVALTIEGATAIVTLIAQISRGYFAIEWKLYLSQLLLIDLTGAGLVCVLAFTLHVIVNHKYIGHAVIVLYYVAKIAFMAIGIEEPLFRYGSDSGPIRYSDMNGYGHMLGPFAWFRVYWWGFAILLTIASYLFFVRGHDTKMRVRIALARQRFNLKAKLAFGVALVVFVSAGGFIFYNTHVLNRYETKKDVERQSAMYEKKYKGEATAPQPSIIAAETSIDIYPQERRFVAKGTYRLVNKGTAPVTRVMITLPEDMLVRDLHIGIGPKGRVTETDTALSVRFITLENPLKPGEEIDLFYDLEHSPKGFGHGEPKTVVVENGTFINNFMLPVIGYEARNEIEGDRDRKSYDLAPKERMAPRDDPNERMHNYLRHDSDFVTFSATVSTSPDQIAMAPGYLEREWTEGGPGPTGPTGRRYFKYVMDQPILNFFSALSARYEVRKDEYNGIKLEILHHPSHTQNLDRMMLGMKDALAYCSEAFGPYQHRQARILEFPRYQMFAQSFPNTIPYSEAIGFIARVREDDPDDVDYPYYVTAHEIAHQWWAHQIIGANTRGATMTTESMAQYTALMVMQKKYGKERMRRFLKFELDGYLRGRFMEKKKELPLAQNENQMYIHYQKGSIAMYALADAIGEDRVNRALKSVTEKWRFKGPPYPTAADLLDAFRVETPPEYQYLIEDLFETITLYDNRALKATMEPSKSGPPNASPGSWEVVLSVRAKKLRSDDKGNQTELDFTGDFIDVGALDERGAAIHIEKRKIGKGESEIRFTVPRKPTKVGIDPLNKLVDRDSDDNVTVPSSG